MSNEPKVDNLRDYGMYVARKRSWGRWKASLGFAVGFACAGLAVFLAGLFSAVAPWGISGILVACGMFLFLFLLTRRPPEP